MEENSELEEGEACYCKDDDDNSHNNNYVDPDVALSYIDEKLQNILGHFQKDFEGGVSAENLGAKFGGYGSFLPTYERSPSTWLRPKTPLTSSSTPMSPNSLPVEGDVQNFKIPPTGPSSVGLGTTSDRTKEFHKLGMRAGGVSVQQDSASIPVVIAQKSSFKDGNLSKPGNLPDQRTLKVRIKVGSDSMARKNAAIYSGLGLDNSPSSSLGNSHEESGGMLLVPQGVADESPTSILQAMTSFPVPEGSLLSPLHDSFLCLIRKERLFGDTRPMPSLKGRQENSALLVNESTSVLGDGNLSKKKEVKFPGKSERVGELKNGKSINLDNDTAILPKKKLENDTTESNGARGRLFFPDSVTEDSLESVSGQSSGRREKISARNSSVEKVSKNRPVINKASASSKVYSDASKCKEDLSVGTLVPSKQNIGQQVTSHVQGEIAIPTLKEKPFLEVKKKSQSTRSSKKAAVISEKESLRVDATAATRDMIGANATSRDKMHKMKLQDDRIKVRDNHADSLATKLEQMNDQVTSWERPCGDRMKDSTGDAVDIEQNGSFNKSKEKIRGKTVDNRSMAVASFKSAAYDGPCVTENALTSEVVPPIVDPVLIEENWVCCDSCQTWRLLPIGTKPEQLPEKWLCSMLTWLPGMNRCGISEEETTRAVQALDLKSKLHNLDNGIGSGAASVRVRNVLQDHQSLDSQVASSQGKKKHGSKEIAKPGSSCVLIPSLNSKRDDLKESVKSRSLNDMNQLPAESNFMNKSSVQHLSKSHELVAEKLIAKQNEKHTNGGHDKQIKKKNKREAVHYGHGTSKKAKKDDVYTADEHQIFDMDPMRTAFNSRNELTKTSGKNMQKSNKYFSLEDVNCDTKERLLAVTKDGTQAQASSDGGSMDVRGSNKRDTSVKKRRLMEWQDNQSGHDIHAENGSESGLKKEKRSRISKRMAKESIMKSANKGRAAGILSSGNYLQPANVMEENGGDDKRQLQKRGRNFASQQTLDGADSFRRDFGSGQVSITATSSSSMISDFLKTRATFDDAKGSPVESVSSSPLRASIPEKPNFIRGDVNGVPVIDKTRRCREREDDDEINQSGPARKEEGSGRSHPERLKVLPCRDANADLKVEGKATSSSDFLDIGDEIMENYQSSSGPLAIQNCREEDKADKDPFDNMLFPQKSAKGSSLALKNENISSTFDFDKDNMKVSNPVSEQEEFCSKKAMRYDSEVDPKSCAPLHKRMNNVTHSIPEKSDAKLGKEKKDHGNWSDAISQCSKDSSMVNQLAAEECDDFDAKLGVPRRYWDSAPQQNLIQDFEGETKDQVQKESRSLTPKLLPHPEGEGKQGSQTHLSVLGSQQGGIFDRLPVHASGNIDVSKASKHPGNGGAKNGTQQSVGHRVPHLKGVKDFNASSPGRMYSPSQTATSTLKEAKDLRDYADRLKSSGFGFESNESYFKAAQKFLLGAALLETHNSEGGKQGEMTQMQAYSTAAKLCKCCALEYESRHEMAAAALAYKCLEVAFWRVVYCKSSTSSRDHGELQASLQMISQGESPSSSASDVDNLNNQAPADKATLSKGTVSHVAGNPVVVSRNHSNFLKLLDFTQDVNFAMDASRKSQNAFSAANVVLEEAQNRDCITSVKKVIDFGFHDVEGFMRLVQLAMEAISPSGFGGARE